MSTSYHSPPFQSPITQNKIFERSQINSLHTPNQNISTLYQKHSTKSLFLKDLNKERKVLKSTRCNDESPLLEIFKKNNYPMIFLKERSESRERSREIFKKNNSFIDRLHTKMIDLEELEEDWKQIKNEHDHKILFSHKDTTKNKKMIEEKQNNPKISRHLVPRSRINLQLLVENSFISKSLNETDLHKINLEENQNIEISTQREVKGGEIENFFHMNISNLSENEKKPIEKELKNKLYMKSIFDKYSNIYKKKTPEATKIGKIVNFDKSFNSFVGNETPKSMKYKTFLHVKENKEEIQQKLSRNIIRKTSLEPDVGREKLTKLFSSKNNKPNEEINPNKREFMKEKKVLNENKNFENLKIANENKNKEVSKQKEFISYSTMHKHKRQLSNTLIKKN